MAHEIKVGQHGEGCECPNCHNRPYAHWKETDQTKCETLRKKKPSFQPEYFSGLNWRAALKKGLVGREVEMSNTTDQWAKRTLVEILGGVDHVYKYVSKDDFKSVYIRTCPETYKHPTITIAGGWKLPRPEIEAPEKGTHYFFLYQNTEIHSAAWEGTNYEYERLQNRRIHLTKARAQAWADWWNNIVIKAVQK